MATASVVVYGTVTPDGVLNLTQKIALPPGPVQITIQPAHEQDPQQTNWWQHLQQSRDILEARGTGFRTQQEIEAEHEAFRAES